MVAPLEPVVTGGAGVEVVVEGAEVELPAVTPMEEEEELGWSCGVEDGVTGVAWLPLLLGLLVVLTERLYSDAGLMEQNRIVQCLGEVTVNNMYLYYVKHK